MGVRVVDRLRDFANSNGDAMDRALNRMAIDIERLSKMQVPVDKGHLRASGLHRRVSKLKYVVEYNKEYARYQEFGGDGRRVVRRYSQPGKKKFFLRDPGKTIAGKALDYFRYEAGRVKV
jgi:hypothetical protein